VAFHYVVFLTALGSRGLPKAHGRTYWKSLRLVHVHDGIRLERVTRITGQSLPAFTVWRVCVLLRRFW
jgi:hypothetical protein